jgi:O-acetylhomoserine (thiol)-lyase
VKPETIALHAGYDGDPATNAATTTIYQTTSYTFDNTQHGADQFNLAVPGNIYSRIMNPTNAVLEQRLTELEGGIGALAEASGMAAIRYAIEAIAQVGSNIVSTSRFYGGR